ncbi:MAG: hypothetical protein U0641_05750 [Anaerolineae bacterium]
MQSEKTVTVEELLQQIQALQCQIHDLHEQVIAQKEGNAQEEASAKFLLAELSALAEVWRHTDKRQETATTMYLTGSTLAVSAAVFLSPRLLDVNGFLTILILVALVLSIAGILLADRIFSTRTRKVEYAYGISLVRGFFVNLNPAITPYLWMPYLDPMKSPQSPFGPLSIRKYGYTTFVVIYVWDSLLLGFAASALIWLVVPDFLRQTALIPLLAITVMVGGIVTFICMIALGLRLKLMFERFEAARRGA